MIAYLNGDLLPIEAAKISVLDRGFLFADGVYEVIPVFEGKVFLLAEHLKRLEFSLREIALPFDSSLEKWSPVIHDIIEKNGGGNLQIYFQITRGFDPVRQHTYPTDLKPTVFLTAFKAKTRSREEMAVTAITREDLRWKRCDIKSIALLPNVMATQAASEQHADECIVIREGYATETTRANLFIVKDHMIITSPLSSWILGGITRGLVLSLANELGIFVQERLITEDELTTAEEIWVTGSLSEIRPVISLNQKPVGTGQPGPLWARVFEHYLTYKQRVVHGQ